MLSTVRPQYPILLPQPRLASRSESCALAVMAKAPRTGEVKTRLVPPLSPTEAAMLNTCFLRDMTRSIADLDLHASVDGFVAFTPVGSAATFNGLLPDGFCLLPQRGANLGERLFHAAEDFFAVGYGAMCLINSDSPTLPSSVLEKAVNALRPAGDRVILGPSDDGGYYLIGLKQEHRALFTDIDWSTDRVMAQTLERAAELELEVVSLPRWYDIDDATGLRRLCSELFGVDDAGSADLVGYHAPHTRNYLRELLKKNDGCAAWVQELALGGSAS